METVFGKVKRHHFDLSRLLEVLEASLETPAKDFCGGVFELLGTPSARENRFDPPLERTEARGFADWLTAE